MQKSYFVNKGVSCNNFFTILFYFEHSYSSPTSAECSKRCERRVIIFSSHPHENVSAYEIARWPSITSSLNSVEHEQWFFCHRARAELPPFGKFPQTALSANWNVVRVPFGTRVRPNDWDIQVFSGDSFEKLKRPYFYSCVDRFTFFVLNHWRFIPVVYANENVSASFRC